MSELPETHEHQRAVPFSYEADAEIYSCEACAIRTMRIVMRSSQ